MSISSGHSLNPSSKVRTEKNKTPSTHPNRFFRQLQDGVQFSQTQPSSHSPSRLGSASQQLVRLPQNSNSQAKVDRTVSEKHTQPGVHAGKRNRSKSPEPDSHANKGRAIVEHSIRTFPTFQKFNSPETDVVQLTREEFLKLQKWAGEKAAYLVSRNDATAWAVLLNPIIQQRLLQGKSNGNSEYENTEIDMPDLRPWKNFPTFIEIENFSRSSPNLRRLFHELMLPNAARKPWYEELFNDPGYIPSNEETSLIRNTHAFFAQLNALIRLACTGPPSGSANRLEGLTSNKWITIGGGKCAMRRRKEGNPEQKIPDLVAFWTDGDDSHLNAKRSEPGFPASRTTCLLVGDFKMATKFNHQMLLPRGHKFLEGAQKVMNQIHDYMDMHHNRFGYVITQKEVIMFRRRDNPPEKWGQLDYSPSIPVSSERGKINAMMVLWYFHVKYGVMGLDGGWELPSFYHNCPRELLGKSAIIKEAAPKKKPS